MSPLRFFARTLRALVFFACAVSAATLSACGGGGGGGGGSAPNIRPSVAANLGVSVVAQNTDCNSGSQCETRANNFRNDAEFQNAGFQHSPLDRVNAQYAYARGFAGRGVTVAVADHGIDMDHPEFAGRVTLGRNAISGEDPTAPEDDTGHGTAVAGILAAARNGSAAGANMHGVAYESTVIPIRILGGGGIPVDIFADALRHGLDNAFVINNSWGNTAMITTDIAGVGRVEATRPEITPDTYSRDALLNARAQDAVVVFAAGNEGWNTENGMLARTGKSCDDSPVRILTPAPGSGYQAGETVCDVRANQNIPGGWGMVPATSPEVNGHWLHVVALDRQNQIANFSNGCGGAKAWCLSAPGTHLVLPDNDGGRQTGSGTSFAAPMVSGAAAILKGAFPNLGARQVVTLLLLTANDLGAPGVDDVYGHGMLDLEKATRPQTNPACGESGYSCPHRRGAVGLRLATAKGGAQTGLDIGDFSLSDLDAARIRPSPVFGGAFARADAAAGFVDGFNRAYQTSVADLAGAPSLLQIDSALALRRESETRTRILADGFFARETSDGAPAQFGWRGRFGKFSAALTESRNLHFGIAQDAAFALGASRWRGVEFEMGEGDGMGGVGGRTRAGFRAAEFSRTDAVLRQWFLGRDFSGEGWDIHPEAGFFDETNSILGADLGGAFSPRGARTFYGRVDGGADLIFGLRGFAGAFLAQTSAEGGGESGGSGGSGGSARFSALRSGGWEAGLEGERWRFSLRRPAGVLSGEMSFSGVAGYDDAGAYRAAESRVDLSAGHSPRLMFAAGSAGGNVWWSAEKERGAGAVFSISGGKIF